MWQLVEMSLDDSQNSLRSSYWNDKYLWLVRNISIYFVVSLRIYIIRE